MREDENYLECPIKSKPNRAESWAHYLDGQYTKERAVLYTQAAELPGLSVTNVEEGKVFSKNTRGYDLKVGKGYVGVKVYVNAPEDLDLFWATLKTLEKAQKEL